MVVTRKKAASRKAVKCDCCELMRINGVICHELGCPNMRKEWKGGMWVGKRS